jgi:AraC family transcriptional activator of pobA
MRKKSHKVETPLYCLSTFSERAKKSSFYIERLERHLEQHAFVNDPHRHDFYLLLYITHGSGNHTIDFKTYTVNPNMVFMMTPGQVHSWQLSKDIRGYIIFFEQDFYQIQNSKTSLLDFSFFHSHYAVPFSTAPVTTIESEILQEMDAIFWASTPVDGAMLGAYLHVLLLRLARKYNPTTQHEIPLQSHRIRKLEHLIESNFLQKRQPSDYADLMHVSTNYLNTLCKTQVGKTLSELIQERIILEAKRIFAYTDVSVSEVSHQLNFSDPSYFARFFKKRVGITPEEFKHSLNRAIK